MSRYCNRDGCGHAEEDHLPASQGGCFAKHEVTRHMCLCPVFVAMDPVLEAAAPVVALCMKPAKPPSVPPLRVVEPVRELEPVRDRAEALERAAARHRTEDPKGTGPLLERFLKPIEEGVATRERLQEHTIIESGAKIMLAGKPREMTELHAATNAIVAETNADDLAAGVFAMRSTIRTQANEIVKLRAELEALSNAKKKVEVKIQVLGDLSRIELSSALGEAAQRLAEPRA